MPIHFGVVCVVYSLEIYDEKVFLLGVFFTDPGIRTCLRDSGGALCPKREGGMEISARED